MRVCSVILLVLCAEVKPSISLLPQNAQRLGASQVTQPLTTPVVSVATPSLLTPFSMPTAYNTGKKVTAWKHDGMKQEKNNSSSTLQWSRASEFPAQFRKLMNVQSMRRSPKSPLTYIFSLPSPPFIYRVSADECRSHGPSGFHTAGCTVAE